MKKSIIAKIIWILLIIILVGGITCLPFIPKLYDIFKDRGVELFNSHTIYYRIAFYTCFILCLVIVWQLIGLFKNVFSDTPFKKEVERALKISAVIFMLLAVIVVVKAVFIPTILSFAVAFICFVASLSFYCLAEVIKAAISYKQEVDYTV